MEHAGTIRTALTLLNPVNTLEPAPEIVDEEPVLVGLGTMIEGEDADVTLP
jgi:hypothetical protein